MFLDKSYLYVAKMLLIFPSADSVAHTSILVNNPVDFTKIYKLMKLKAKEAHLRHLNLHIHPARQIQIHERVNRFGLGLKISTRRLCVRISYCSCAVF